MNTELSKRLDEVLSKITSKSFLSNEGLGNEIACHIFDYDAEHELHVRERIDFIVKRIESHHADIKVLHLDLFDVVIDHLANRKLLDKARKMQEEKGDKAVLKALKGPLAAEKIRDHIAAEYQPDEYDLLLLSGIGSMWPMLRAHSLLNCMHTVMGDTPLVMFHPGSFDGTTLRLFGCIASNTTTPGAKAYYRAFNLVPREKRK